MQSSSLRQGLLLFMNPHSQKGLLVFFSSIWVASLISLNQSLSHSVNILQITSLFFPFVTILYSSSKAQKAEFFRPLKVPLFPHRANIPSTFSSGRPRSRSQASSVEIRGVLLLKRNYYILRRWTDVLTVKPCWFLYMSLRISSIIWEGPFASPFILIKLHPRLCQHIFISMEIKINFNQLFSSGNELNTTQETPSTPVEQSFNSLSDSFEYQLSLDPQLFQPQPSKKPSSHLSSPSHHSEQSLPSHSDKKSDHISNMSHLTHAPAPGERLYYQSQANQVRKMKERERIELEKQTAIKSMPFAPKINKNSRKMAEKWKAEPKPSKKEETKTTKELKEEKEAQECTFKPKLFKKTARAPKTKEEIFYMLHSASKIRQMKLKERKQEQEVSKPVQKMTEKQFSQFLRRNEEYANLTKKKLELMKQSAQQYDFKTGEKLFSPRISDSKPPAFQSSASRKKLSPPECQLKSGIFRKKQQHYDKLFDEDSGEDSCSSPFQKTQCALFKGETEKQRQFQQDLSEEYRKYSEEYDRMLSLHEGSLSNHEVIFEEPEVKESSEASQMWEQSGDIQGEELNMWGSAEVSNVKQYLAGSQEDEHQPRTNYVMDILTNLINSRPEEDEEN